MRHSKGCRVIGRNDRPAYQSALSGLRNIGPETGPFLIPRQHSLLFATLEERNDRQGSDDDPETDDDIAFVGEANVEILPRSATGHDF